MWRKKETRIDDLTEFLIFFLTYLHEKILGIGMGIENWKNFLVVILLAKRGKYSQTFLNTSFLILTGAVVIVWPAIANNNPFLKDDTNETFFDNTVTTNYDDYEAVTIISEKPRDKIVEYQVKSGDTLKSIAEFFDISSDSIVWLNNISSNKIKQGQTLKIPPISGVVHKVKTGETIYSIAKKYQTEAQNIINFTFNEYADGETFALTPGQTLFVPDGIIEETKPGSVGTPTRTRVQIAAGQAGTGSFIWPTSGVITQYMSWYHPALDIANRSNPPVIASDRGTVVIAGWSNSGYGNHVVVDHGNGYQTLYAHLLKIEVNAGQGVDRGSRLGIMGSTGRSTGTHLHFEIHQGGKKLNPLSLLK